MAVFGVKLWEEVERQVHKTPDSVAIIYDGADGRCCMKVTYNEMWRKACQVCEELRRHGTENEVVVGVCMAPGENLPSVLLGIMQTGSAYFPFGLDGIGFVHHALQRLHVKHLVLDHGSFKSLESMLFKLQCRVIPSVTFQSLGLHLIHLQLETGEKTQLHNVPDLAYCITTSGTTGVPKIVRVPHSCIVPNVADFRRTFQPAVGDLTFLTSPLTFDPSVIDIFMTLTSGASLLLVPQTVKMTPERLLAMLCKQHKVSILQITPSLFRHFGTARVGETLLSANSSLRVLAFGGEEFPDHGYLEKCMDPDNSTAIYNLFGITELSCWATLQLVRPPKGSVAEKVSIGSALTGTKVKVLDNEGREVPNGTGHIWIGGGERRCLVDNETGQTLKQGEVWRNTGDLGKVDGQGHIYCLGRNDRQRKRNGKRLDLDTMEEVCKAVRGIQESRAVLSDNKLYLFLQSVMLETERDQLCSKVKSHLTFTLPSQYNPDYIAVVQQFPVTEHGKLDQNMLLTMNRSEKTSLNFLLPVEPWLSMCLKETTGNGTSSPSDQFLLCGGDSLKAIQLVNEIEKITGCTIPDLLDTVLTRTWSDILASVEQTVNKVCDLKVRHGIASVSRYLHAPDSTPAAVEDQMLKSNKKNTISDADQVSEKLDYTSKRNQPEFAESDSNGPACLDIHRGDGFVKKMDSQLSHSSGVSTVAEIRSIQRKHRNSKERIDKNCELSLTKKRRLDSFDDRDMQRRPHLENDSATKKNIGSKNDLQSYRTPDSQNTREMDNELGVKNDKEIVSLNKTCSQKCVFIASFGRANSSKHTLSDHHSLQCSEGLRHVSTHEQNTNYQDGQCFDEPKSQRSQHRKNSCICKQKVQCGGTHLMGNLIHTTEYCGQHKRHANGGDSNNSLHQQKDTNRESSGVSMQLKKQWAVNTGKCVDASPLVAVTRCGRKIAFIGSHSHKLFAINVDDGTVLWMTEVGDRIEGSACLSPCGQFVVVGCYDSNIYVLNSATGRVEWTEETGDLVKCTPVADLSSLLIFCGSHDGLLYALDCQHQKVAWKMDCGGGGVLASPVASSDGSCVMAATLQGHILAVSIAKGEIIWSVSLGKPVFSSPAVDGDHLYVATVDNTMFCLSCTTGQQVWTYKTDAPVFSSPVVAEGLAGSENCTLFGCHDNHLYCLSESGELLWKRAAPSTVYASPCLFSLCRNNTSVLCCNNILCRRSPVGVHTDRNIMVGRKQESHNLFQNNVCANANACKFHSHGIYLCQCSSKVSSCNTAVSNSEKVFSNVDYQDRDLLGSFKEKAEVESLATCLDATIDSGATRTSSHCALTTICQSLERNQDNELKKHCANERLKASDSGKTSSSTLQNEILSKYNRHGRLDPDSSCICNVCAGVTCDCERATEKRNLQTGFKANEMHETIQDASRAHHESLSETAAQGKVQGAGQKQQTILNQSPKQLGTYQNIGILNKNEKQGDQNPKIYTERQLYDMVIQTHLIASASTDGTVAILGSETGEMLGSVSLPGEVFSSPVVVGDQLIVGCRDDFVYCYQIRALCGSALPTS